MTAKITKVYSRNNVYQHIEVLKRNREKRNRYKKFFVEGVKSINRLVDNKWDIQSWIYTLDTPMSKWAKDILKTNHAKEHIQLTEELMSELSDKDEPSELIAIVSIPNDDMLRIPIHDKLLLVLFDRPSNHGNLGTIIRSCDSFRVDGLIITGHCVDLYDPQTIRASVGSLFTVPVVRLPSHKHIVHWLSKIRETLPNFNIVGTDERAEEKIMDHDFTAPTAFVLGNESDGMSWGYQQLCDSTVKIPMYGSASSLNVAAAASIVLYEIDRQRQ